MSMIETVARAIRDADNGIDGDTVGTMLHENFRVEVVGDDNGFPALDALCRVIARAAIAAMREPTEAMGMAGTKTFPEINSDTVAANPARWSMPTWRTMIDAALAEGGADG